MRAKVPQKTSWKELLAMMMTIALPVAMQNLLSTTGSMVDTIMLGRLGETTVGAVGLCAQFTSLMFSGYWGFIGGGMLFIAQFWGEGNHDGIRKSYGIMLAFVAMTATAATYLALCKPMWVMQLYTNSETIQKIGVEYLSLVGFSYVFQVLAVAMSALLRSVERVAIGLPLNMILTIMLAYPLSKESTSFRMRTVYVWIFFFTMLFSGGLIPGYLLIQNLKMMDTIWALVLPAAVPVYNVI